MNSEWKSATLKDVCVVDWGNTSLTKSSYIEEGPYLAVSAAGCDGRIAHREHKRFTPVLSAIGAQCGRMFFPDEDFTAIKNTITLTPREGKVTGKFLFYLLTSVQLPRRGAGQPFISKGDIQAFPVDVPELSEQERIVGILDEAFEGIGTAKVNAEHNLRNARALFTSRLVSVLTERAIGWKDVRIDALFKVGSSKRVLKSEWKSKGVPFYRGREITRLASDGYVANELFISEAHFAQLSKDYGVPQEGDIVITAIGTIGNAHVVRKSDRFYFKDASVLWLKRTAEVSSAFVKLWIRSPLFHGQLERGNGATVDTLTIQKLQSIVVRLPEISAQRKIVEDLIALEEETQRLERLYEQKLSALDGLKRSLLHSAFTGQL